VLQDLRVCGLDVAQLPTEHQIALLCVIR